MAGVGRKGEMARGGGTGPKHKPQWFALAENVTSGHEMICVSHGTNTLLLVELPHYARTGTDSGMDCNA